ncbi:hypothetical protein [Anaeromyxobacter oryzae]|uniref:Cytochrome c family protein n=1 Tax=Anaeromyxobacter oryzae TaxID=2918170 RepID=A0ABN6MW32_9BACT|nr:hypothetical protein [Anaeromyxobacter oryzae]BDG05229.1 hypothetical protein AMOR_42250 [Anaeromyxobacter oryzae]
MRGLHAATLAICMIAPVVSARSQAPQPPGAPTAPAAPPATPAPSPTPAPTITPAPTTTPAAPATGSCALSALPPDAARVADCAPCHDRSNHPTHPIGVDYVEAAKMSPERFRPAAEVLARGVYLRNGEVACGTCHDPSSPWKNHIALPQGAPARPAVVPGRPETYDARQSEQTVNPGAAPSKRTEVSAKPLCMACHAFD